MMMTSRRIISLLMLLAFASLEAVKARAYHGGSEKGRRLMRGLRTRRNINDDNGERRILKSSKTAMSTRGGPSDSTDAPTLEGSSTFAPSSGSGSMMSKSKSKSSKSGSMSMSMSMSKSKGKSTIAPTFEGSMEDGDSDSGDDSTTSSPTESLELPPAESPTTSPDTRANPNDILTGGGGDTGGDTASDATTRTFTVNSEMKFEFFNGEQPADDEDLLLDEYDKEFFQRVLSSSSLSQEFVNFDTSGLDSSWDATTRTLTLTFASNVDFVETTEVTEKMIAEAMADGNLSKYIRTLKSKNLEGIHRIIFRGATKK